MTKTMWMVRAGEGGYLIDEFSNSNLVAISWEELGDLSQTETLEQIRDLYEHSFADDSVSRIGNAVAMIYKFRSAIAINDYVISYDSYEREYHLGEVTGSYKFDLELIEKYPHLRPVKWLGQVSRDDLSVTARNSLGSVLTVFQVNEDVTSEILSIFRGNHTRSPIEDAEDEKAELDQIKEDTVSRAHELIKDKILDLSDTQMEHLAAAILRAMGYRTRVMPKGPDRGVDVFASPDGLGLEEPRIKVEVKHRAKQMGSQDIRSFLGGLREGDRALYVSTGGFSKDARYEADRANNPLTLLGLDDLAALIVSHYENFDVEGRLLIPLVRIYWPAE